MTTCDKCGGRGWIRVSELSVRDCACIRKTLGRGYLTNAGFPFWDGETLKQAEPYSAKFLDARCVLVEGPWPVVSAAMAMAIITPYCAPTNCDITDLPKVRIVTDSELRSAYYPDAGRPEDRVTFLDQMAAPDLMIIRLGVYAQKNSAIAAILLEGLQRRETKRSWLTTEDGHPWNKTHPAWSPELDAYVKSRFQKFDTID